MHLEFDRVPTALSASRHRAPRTGVTDHHAGDDHRREGRRRRRGRSTSSIRRSARSRPGPGLHPGTARRGGRGRRARQRDMARRRGTRGARRCSPSPTRSWRLADQLTATLSRETGKPLPVAGAEPGICAAWLQYYAGMAIPRELLQDDETARIELAQRPLGVVAAITPWNFPLGLAMWKIAPALLAGQHRGAQALAVHPAGLAAARRDRPVGAAARRAQRRSPAATSSAPTWSRTRCRAR